MGVGGGSKRIAPLASTALETATMAARASIGPRSVSRRTAPPSETAVTRVPSAAGRPGAEAGDEGAVARGQPPVGVAGRLIVGEEVGDREPVGPRAVHEAAERVDEGPPRVVRRASRRRRGRSQAGRGGAAGRRPRRRPRPRAGCFGEAPRSRELPAPGGVAAVEGEAFGLGQRGERVALGRMQPAAAEIERQAGDAPGPGASAELRQRLDQQDRSAGPGSQRAAAIPAAPPPTMATSTRSLTLRRLPVAPSVSAGAMPTRSPSRSDPSKLR